MAAVDIGAQPGSIRLGESFRLSWASTNATTVTISHVGAVEGSGYRDLKPTTTTTYTIVGANSTGGYATASVTVDVVKQGR